MTITPMRRRLSAALLTVGIAVGAAAVGAGSAAAHVTVYGPSAKPGGYGVLEFRVPNESDTNAATTELTVTLPHLDAARAEPKPGWDISETRDSDTKVTSITWKAQAGQGIAVNQFGIFRISGGPLPDAASVELPAVQTYSDGEVVKWDQPQETNGQESEHPAPLLALSTPAAPAASDTTARVLGGVGIGVGAVGLLAALAAIYTRRSATTGKDAA